MSLVTEIVEVSARLSEDLSGLVFHPPVTHVYDPTKYARRSHVAYLEFARRGVDALLLGMNPGPWGMAQTGVPFGEVAHVREFLGISEPVDRPDPEHPKRPVLGFECPRSEVSGRRLWSWVEDQFGAADHFFERFFVWNWCPLAFLEESGRNHTPDKLPVGERSRLERICDAALVEVVACMQPRMVIGVGAFARKRAERALGSDMQVEQILHPSPASPAANRGWAPQVEHQLESIGLNLSIAVR
ncbi:MAG: single-stranded DNA-binding protein [Phycisphaerales bacterium]|nr:single-stranded DNA-binding protein [Phycisphaerales bacterium]MDP6891266.1 single-stranded DNA-binding protein [Phycisphaerales bacterium]